MDVFIQEGDFGNRFDLFFIESGPYERRLLRSTVTEEGTFLWISEPLGEDVRPPGPTMQLNRAMLDALKEALKDSKVEAGDELVRRLRLEEGRVDKLMDHVLAQPIVITENTKVAYKDGGTQ